MHFLIQLLLQQYFVQPFNQQLWGFLQHIRHYQEVSYRLQHYLYFLDFQCISLQPQQLSLKDREFTWLPHHLERLGDFSLSLNLSMSLNKVLNYKNLLFTSSAPSLEEGDCLSTL
jgi:hypothetical protein